MKQLVIVNPNYSKISRAVQAEVQNKYAGKVLTKKLRGEIKKKLLRSLKPAIHVSIAAVPKNTVYAKQRGLFVIEITPKLVIRI